jgi:hypothetical protein
MQLMTASGTLRLKMAIQRTLEVAMSYLMINRVFPAIHMDPVPVQTSFPRRLSLLHQESVPWM